MDRSIIITKGPFIHAVEITKVKFVIVTLGENGCIMLERSMSSQSSILTVLHISSQIGFCNLTISLPIVSPSSFAENSYCRSSEIRKIERWEDHGNSEAKDSSWLHPVVICNVGNVILPLTVAIAYTLLLLYSPCLRVHTDVHNLELTLGFKSQWNLMQTLIIFPFFIYSRGGEDGDEDDNDDNDDSDQ